MTDAGLVDTEGMATAQGWNCPELLAPERFLRVRSIEEAREACECLFVYGRAEIRLEQIVLEDDFGVTFLGDRYRPTEKALEDICALVKVPAAFAKVIPSDLVAALVRRLKGLHQQTVVTVYRDGVLVAVVDPLKWARSRAKQRRPHYQPVPTARLLAAISNALAPPCETTEVVIADSGVSVEVLHPELSLEPRVGDVTRVGVVVTGSETGGPMPLARVYALRLACTNGATAPTTFGVLRFSTDWRVNFDVRLRAFEAGLRSFSMDLDRLRRTYQRLAAETVTDHLFYSLYRRVRYIYRHVQGRDRLADNALGVEGLQRRQIVARGRRPRVGVQQAHTPIESAQPVEPYAWDLFNSITAAARQEPYRRRIALQRLAGDLLQAYAPARRGPR